MVFNQAISEFTECHVTAFHLMNIFKLNHYVIIVLISVPIDKTEGIQMLYVFVDIAIDMMHFIDTLKHNFQQGAHLSLVSTIQFVAALQVRRNK